MDTKIIHFFDPLTDSQESEEVDVNITTSQSTDDVSEVADETSEENLNDGHNSEVFNSGSDDDIGMDED
ncbi:hypothetical protein TKK_0013617 [Trichogramma kaykai]